MGTIEEMARQSDFINPEAFATSSMDKKLLTMVTSLNRLHTKFNGVHDNIHKEKIAL